MKKVAIQGIESSFHDLATRNMFPEQEIQLVPCVSFEEVTNSLATNKADFGVIAIENTIAGSILPNYNLIDNGDFTIVDETYLTIEMYLMALQGETVHTIDEVHSHPVALQQCKEYLRRLQPHCKVVEGKDTASEARKIKENNLRGVAAIAGKHVAEAYGLEILDSKIQKIKENRTRFVTLARGGETQPTMGNKASLKFVLNHDIGSLANILQILSTFDINLTKIQSLPILKAPWEYAFFVDVLFSDMELFEEVVAVLKRAVKELKILGVYVETTHNHPSKLKNEIAYAK